MPFLHGRESEAKWCGPCRPSAFGVDHFSDPEQVVAHPWLIVVPESIEKVLQALEGLRSQFGAPVTLNGAGGLSVGRQVGEGPRGEPHRILSRAGRGSSNLHVAPITKIIDDLAGALAADVYL